ncbi:hypothetical protein [Proteiniphilum sp. X52]|uniref:hypothetical protein n=1 Tax=Proteiniphilum sp. X52 TaxID=2382159 RepID=UPI001C86ADBB|nr:hypothetical protein [Proteiniphilum sp. X52]
MSFPPWHPGDRLPKRRQGKDKQIKDAEVYLSYPAVSQPGACAAKGTAAGRRNKSEQGHMGDA